MIALALLLLVSCDVPTDSTVKWGDIIGDWNGRTGTMPDDQWIHMSISDVGYVHAIGGSDELPLQGYGVLDDTTLTLTVDDSQLVGDIDGNTISGTITSPRGELEFQVVRD